jgi:SAM-dependent methyltransferase
VNREHWYEVSFGDLYPTIYSHRDDASASREAEAIIALLGLSPGETRVLDLCCGGGRHAGALSELGYMVFGLDLSEHLLSHAISRCGLSGRLVRADIRQLPFLAEIDVVLNLFTSFGYFADDKENEAALSEMARVLTPGGYVLMDHMNPPSVRRNLGENEKSTGNVKIRQKRRIENNRIKKDITITENGTEPRILREDVRMYEQEEMKDLLSRAGLGDVTLYGSLAGTDLTSESERMIAVARKKGGIT